MQASEEAISDLAELSAALERFDKLTVQQFCKLCEGITIENAQAARPSDTRSNLDLVASYSQKLLSAGSDRGKFEAALAQMRADKDLKIAELSEIAKRFVGGTNKYAKKSDAFKDIKLRFDAHRRATKRLDAASEIF